MPTYWIVTDEGGSIMGLYFNREDAHEDIKHEGREHEWTAHGFELVDRPQWPSWHAIKINRLRNQIVERGAIIDKLKLEGRLHRMPNRHRRLRREISADRVEISRLQKELSHYKLRKDRVFAQDKDYDPEFNPFTD